MKYSFQHHHLNYQRTKIIMCHANKHMRKGFHKKWARGGQGGSFTRMPGSAVSFS